MKPIAAVALLALIMASAAATAAIGASLTRQPLPRIGLDRSFGSDGTVIASAGDLVPGLDDEFGIDATSAVVDRRGRLTVGADGWSHALLARYARTGVPDRSFGDGGVAFRETPPFGAPGGPVVALALDPFERLVASIGDKQDLIVARFSPEGRLDPGFGDAGIAAFQIPASVGSMQEGAPQASSVSIDGRITVARVNALRASRRSGTGFVLARFTEDGKLDESFGDGGVFTASLAHSHPFQLAYAGLDGSGERVVVVSTAFVPVRDEDQRPERKRFEVVRLLPDGTPDPGFGGGDGRVQLTVGRYGTIATAIAFDSRERMVVAGRSGRGFGFSRLRPDGTLDRRFGSGGQMTIPAGRRLAEWDLGAIAIDDGDRIVAAGSAAFAGTKTRHFTAFRLRPSGALDRSFGRSGTCTAAFPRRRAFPSAVTTLPDGDALLSGTALLPRRGVYPPRANPISELALAKCKGRP